MPSEIRRKGTSGAIRTIAIVRSRNGYAPQATQAASHHGCRASEAWGDRMSIKRRTAEHRLARLTGISGHTVRYYVTEGLLNLSRLNSRTERELAMRIKFITVLREIGLPLGYIAELIQYRMASSQQKEPIAQYLAARLQYVDSQARRAAAEKRRLAKASEEFRRIAADDDVTTVEFFRRLRSAARHLSDCGETKQRTPRTRTAKDRSAKAQYGSPRKPE